MSQQQTPSNQSHPASSQTQQNSNPPSGFPTIPPKEERKQWILSPPVGVDPKLAIFNEDVQKRLRTLARQEAFAACEEYCRELIWRVKAQEKYWMALNSRISQLVLEIQNLAKTTDNMNTGNLPPSQAMEALGARIVTMEEDIASIMEYLASVAKNLESYKK